MSVPESTTTPSEASEAVLPEGSGSVDPDRLEAQAELLARAALYKAVSRVTGDPVQSPLIEEADLDAAAAAAELLEVPELVEVIERLRALRPRSQDEARAKYTAVFGLVVSEEAPPFETEYEKKADLFYRVAHMADVTAYYRAFGLDLANRERPDQIAVEAEFLWYLLERLAYARVQGHGPEKEEILTSAFHSFFTEHYGRWGPGFAARFKDLAKLRQEPFYEAAAELMRRTLDLERRVQGLTDEAPERPPKVVEMPVNEACGACDDIAR